MDLALDGVCAFLAYFFRAAAAASSGAVAGELSRALDDLNSSSWQLPANKEDPLFAKDVTTAAAAAAMISKCFTFVAAFIMI